MVTNAEDVTYAEAIKYTTEMVELYQHVYTITLDVLEFVVRLVLLWTILTPLAVIAPTGFGVVLWACLAVYSLIILWGNGKRLKRAWAEKPAPELPPGLRRLPSNLN